MSADTFFKNEMRKKAGDAWSVAERQHYERLALEGAPSEAKVRENIGSAWSVAERQQWEGLLLDLYGKDVYKGQ